jgi:hypothetical protein
MHDGGGDRLLSVTVIVLGSHLNPVESNLDYANFGSSHLYCVKVASAITYFSTFCNLGDLEIF